MKPLEPEVNIVKQTLIEFIGDDSVRLSASLAYYTIFSLPPLLVIVITVAGLALDPQQVEGTLQRQVGEMLEADAATQIETMIQSASDRVAGGFSVGLVLSIVGVLIGATAAFGELQYALNQVWGVEPDTEQGMVWSYLFDRLLSLGMILVIAFLLLLTLVLSALISVVQRQMTNGLDTVGLEGLSGGIVWALDTGASLLMITFLFAAIFKVLPDVSLKWRNVGVGAFITALLFVVGKFLIGFYIGQSNLGDGYGAAAALSALLIWIYYSSLILLLGAEFTQIWARRH